MTREYAINTLKENCCAMCAYGSQDMESCDIRSCDDRDAIKTLEQEPCEGCVSKQTLRDVLREEFHDDLVAGILSKLPSVYPKRDTEEIPTITIPVEDYLKLLNAIPLPDNATNGDVIKALFIIDRYPIDLLEHTVWWNAPYRKEQNNEPN